jgi:hypothetical protein
LPEETAVVGYLYRNEWMPERDGTVCAIVARANSVEHGTDVPTFVVEFSDGYQRVVRAEALSPWYPN